MSSSAGDAGRGRMLDGAISIVVCGASAAAFLPVYALHLRQRLAYPTRYLLTHSAERFVRAEAVAMFADEVYRSHAADLVPTELAHRSRAMIVLPATANLVASMALGLAATPAQTALLAAPGPVLVFPSMNRVMWQRSSTQRHVRTLRADGHAVVDPAETDVYENWQRAVTRSPGLASPDQVTKIVVDWLSIPAGDAGTALVGTSSGVPA